MKLGTMLLALAMLAMGAFGCGGSDEGTEAATTDEQASGGEETAPADDTAADQTAPADGAANPCAGGAENPCGGEAAPAE